MADTDKLDLQLTRVYFHRPNEAIVTGEMPPDDDGDDEDPHTLVYNYNRSMARFEVLGQWTKAIVGSACLAGDPFQRFFLSADGFVFRRTKEGVTREAIDASDEGPSRLLLMRQMRAIAGNLYVVGMARRVYQRLGLNQWQAIDQGCFVPRAQQSGNDLGGFNDLAGDRSDNLVAVGYNGEIWRRDAKGWHREGSPTNVTLTSIAQVSVREFIACGLHGTVVVGGPGQWSLLKQTTTRGDFWDVVRFRGASYLSSYDGVFLFDEQDLRKVYPPSGVVDKTAHLAAGDSMMSVGPKTVAISDNGSDWTTLPNP